MKKYIKPSVEVLLFDEEEILAASSVSEGTYSMDQLNNGMFNGSEGMTAVGSTVSIDVRKLTIRDE
jgi:hypothetical protein